MTDMSQGNAPIASSPNPSVPRATAPAHVPQYVYTQTDFRRYIAALGGLLAAFGVVAFPVGFHLGSAFWSEAGVLALIFGAAILVVQLFLTAYRRPDTRRPDARRPDLD